MCIVRKKNFRYFISFFQIFLHFFKISIKIYVFTKKKIRVRVDNNEIRQKMI